MSSLILNNPKGSYNPITKVYTDPYGNKQSRAYAPKEATIEIVSTPTQQKPSNKVEEIVIKKRRSYQPANPAPTTEDLPKSSLSNVTPSAELIKTVEDLPKSSLSNPTLEATTPKVVAEETKYKIVNNKPVIEKAVTYQIPEYNLKTVELQKMISSGAVQGYSGIGLTHKQAVKKELLEKLGVIQKTNNVFEYYSPIHKSNKIKISDVKKEFIEPISYLSKYDNYENLKTGQASPLINVGPPIKTNSIKDFMDSYKKNILDFESTKSSINLALFSTGYKSFKLVNPVLARIPKKYKYFGLGVLAGEAVAPVVSYLDTKYLPQPTSKIGRFSKAVAEGAVVGANPFLSGVYFEQFVKSIYKNPYETSKSMIQNYPETLGYIVGGGIGERGKIIAKDIKATRGMKEIKLADINTKPFLRRNEAVYMKRFEGIKLKEPSSLVYYLKGYKKGQFIERQRPLVPPEILAYYKGIKKGDFWQPVIKDKKVIGFEKIKQKTVSMSYGALKDFKTYFDSVNKQVYGLPQKDKLFKKIKDYSFGYSATSTRKPITKIGEAGQFFSGRGISAGFLRLGNKYKIDLKLKNLMFGDEPIVYASYAKKSKVVPNAYEIVVKNPYVQGGKPIKKYIFPKEKLKSGEFYIPTNKPEVQAVAYGAHQILREGFYFKLASRRVPIKETLLRDDIKIINEKINKDLKKSKVIGNVSSILPSKKPFYSYLLKPTKLKLSGSSKLIKMSNYDLFKIPKSAVSNKYLISSSSINNEISKSIFSINKSISNEINKSLANTSKSISKEINKSLNFHYNKSNILNISSKKSTNNNLRTLTAPAEKSVLIFTKKNQNLKKAKISKEGYDVYGKSLKTNKLFKINTLPLTKSRAEDVGAYYVKNTLARTFKVKKTNKPAGEDYQFIYIPQGYYLMYKNQIREYKIKKGKPISIGEIYIQKGKYSISTVSEKNQLKRFRSLIKSILK